MKKRILLADDDEELCQEIMGILSETGFEVEAVFNGLDAFSRVSKEKFDLLVLDLKLPGLDGTKVLQSIRKEGMKLKVLVLSGSPIIQHLLKGEGIAAGSEEAIISEFADAVIPKPCYPEMLITKISQLLN